MRPSEFSDRQKKWIVAAYQIANGGKFLELMVTQCTEFSPKEVDDIRSILTTKGVLSPHLVDGLEFTPEGREIAREIIAEEVPPHGQKTQTTTIALPLKPKRVVPPLRPPARSLARAVSHVPVGKMVVVPSDFQSSDFDLEEMRFLLSAYQQNGGTEFNWRAIQNESPDVSRAVLDQKATRLQDMGAVRILSADGHAALTAPARALMESMVESGKADECEYWTWEQIHFIASGAILAGRENIPFHHTDVTHGQRDAVRRQLIGLGILKATGPNEVKTTFTPKGVERLVQAVARRTEPRFSMFRQPRIEAEFLRESDKPPLPDRPSERDASFGRIGHEEMDFISASWGSGDGFSFRSVMDRLKIDFDRAHAIASSLKSMGMVLSINSMGGIFTPEGLRLREKLKEQGGEAPRTVQPESPVAHDPHASLVTAVREVATAIKGEPKRGWKKIALIGAAVAAVASLLTHLDEIYSLYAKWFLKH